MNATTSTLVHAAHNFWITGTGQEKLELQSHVYLILMNWFPGTAPAMDALPIYSRNTSQNVFPGNDFSNNIFTDLAPLLTLFGDQLTKQFLSMSMGWADNALIAICPIGILTIMVSAIRIGGASKLKTLIGRYGLPCRHSLLA